MKVIQMKDKNLELETLSKTISSQMRRTTRVSAFRLKEFEGFDYIGNGISRSVFAKGEFVLKIESKRSTKFYKQNKIEWKTYKNLPEHLKKHFAKPLKRHRNYHWILSERAMSVELGYEEKDEIVNQLRKILLKNMLRCTDLHRANVGLIHDQPVLLDYGMELEEMTVKERDSYAKRWEINLKD